MMKQNSFDTVSLSLFHYCFAIFIRENMSIYDIDAVASQQPQLILTNRKLITNSHFFLFLFRFPFFYLSSFFFFYRESREILPVLVHIGDSWCATVLDASDWTISATKKAANQIR